MSTTPPAGLTWRGLGLGVGAVAAFSAALLPYGLMSHAVLGYVSFWIGWGCAIYLAWATVAVSRGCRDIRRVGRHIIACLFLLVAIMCGVWEPKFSGQGMAGRGLFSILVIGLLLRGIWASAALPWRVRGLAGRSAAVALVGVTFLSLTGPMMALHGAFHSPVAEMRVAAWLSLLGGVLLGVVALSWGVDALVKSLASWTKKTSSHERGSVITKSARWRLTGVALTMVVLIAATVLLMPGPCAGFGHVLVVSPGDGTAPAQPPEKVSACLQAQGFQKLTEAPPDLSMVEREAPLAAWVYPFSEEHSLIITISPRRSGLSVDYQYEGLSAYENAKAARLIERVRGSLKDERPTPAQRPL